MLLKHVQSASAAMVGTGVEGRFGMVVCGFVQVARVRRRRGGEFCMAFELWCVPGRGQRIWLRPAEVTRWGGK